MSLTTLSPGRRRTLRVRCTRCVLSDSLKLQDVQLVVIEAYQQCRDLTRPKLISPKSRVVSTTSWQIAAALPFVLGICSQLLGFFIGRFLEASDLNPLTTVSVNRVDGHNSRPSMLSRGLDQMKRVLGTWTIDMLHLRANSEEEFRASGQELRRGAFALTPNETLSKIGKV